MQISTEASAQEAANAAADFIAIRLRTAVEERGVATLALSGGSTPKLMYTALGMADLPWPSIHIFQVDERVAPEADDARNALHIVECLISHVALPNTNWHPMPVEISPLDRAAERYAEQLTRVCEGRLDVVHLGLGDDGHTASWPPGDPVLSSTQLVDVVRQFRGFDRLTLTPRAVNAANVVTWLVVGSDKSHVLMDWERRDPLLPSSVVRRDETDALFIDKQAGVRG